MIKANKGEWSELYTLFKVLGEKKIYAADGDLNKLQEYYPVLKVLRDELNRHIEYTLDKDVVILTEDGTEFLRLDVSSFLQHAEMLFKEISSHKNSAFDIPSLDGFMKKIHCEKVKAKSDDKADIHIVIHDYHTGAEPNLGFSIKSEVGSNPTLFNASMATTFEYRVVGDGMSDELMESINSIDCKSKVRERVKAIYDAGCSLEWDNIPNSVFMNNLVMICDSEPQILAWLLADCFAQNDMDIERGVERISEVNPLNYNQAEGHDFYGYRIKTFFTAIALGMVPATAWDGKYDATGGYLVVKEDGDVVCFHIYDRNRLEDYLFKNTKFETPSSSRYNFAKIYKKEDGYYYFNLVMQIRFK